MARDAHVARIAGYIEDPVRRLRFLRAAAPKPSLAGRLARIGLRRWMLWSAIPLALLIPFLLKLAAGKPRPLPASPVAAQPAPVRGIPAAVPVWQVEQSGDSEVYSNGLRIDTRYTVATRPRSYLAFPRDAGHASAPVARTGPAGIVYHTTESCQAPFEAEATPVLKRLGESLLAYVRRKRAYHYLIDRFGRVYRVVAESDIAWHAGHSVWAGEHWLYLDLNDSFLGVAFEAQTNAGAAEGVVSPAQVRAAAMLTELLRSRYPIAAGNCVTHAQVSVNPAKMLAGYHTDWAAGFPFEALGLPDNYQHALPSLSVFGFDYEAAWLHSIGKSMSAAVARAEQEIASRAASAGKRPAAYRKTLQKQYRARLLETRRWRERNDHGHVPQP